MNSLQLYNTLTRTKAIFEPLNPPFVGMYLCGPTVYGYAHLGHARPAISFDVLFRYLKLQGYQVRYVRNITDVGHLADEVNDRGEDKLIRQAKLEQLEPMEVAQRFTDAYHVDMDALEVLRPSIEPRATGHIPEQIRLIQEILANGFAYEAHGSVYFNVRKYNESYPYGTLSGRKIEDLMEGYRTLEGQDEKQSPLDFALWKKATPEHLMQWDSPWGRGYPGWHIECTAMSTRYLGTTFDIHCGGLDLMFPHHEAEIAQANAAFHPCEGTHKNEARTWLHCNLITINGQKIGKSLNNFITLQQLFTGNHPALERAYAPMVVRFFILQSHYRSTLDFSNDALTAAGKAYRKLSDLLYSLQQLVLYANDVEDDGNPVWEIPRNLEKNCLDSINDDLNTAKVIAHLFGVSTWFNTLKQDVKLLQSLPGQVLKKLVNVYETWFQEILGLQLMEPPSKEILAGVMELVISFRQQAKLAKDYASADKIREELQLLNITLKDSREGTHWSYEPKQE